MSYAFPPIAVISRGGQQDSPDRHLSDSASGSLVATAAMVRSSAGSTDRRTRTTTCAFRSHVAPTPPQRNHGKGNESDRLPGCVIILESVNSDDGADRKRLIHSASSIGTDCCFRMACGGPSSTA